MKNKGGFSKVLAVTGTVLVWCPIAFTILTSIIGTIGSRTFRFDYLMPAELFPVFLVGGLLLLWAAKRARSHQKTISLGMGTAVLSLVGGQAIAVVTGLASGAIEPAGWPFAIVIASLALYSLIVIGIGMAGILLVRTMFLSK